MNVSELASRVLRPRRAWVSTLMVACTLVAPGAAAQTTGVSDERVVLPDGPGSIEGIGDNVSVEGNMGAMSYSVPIEVPEGYSGMTPELTLSYSSSAGAGLLGVGWTMHVPSIERLTLRGLPRYVPEDEFAADGGEQLVRIGTPNDGVECPGGGSRCVVYRSRFERSFVRYAWHSVGDGAAGYWTAQYPDGRVGYFGATRDGTIVHEARLSGARGETFRYLLVEVVDVFGHRIRYDYEKRGVTPLLRRIGWVFEGSDPRYTVELEYEPRPDPLSNAEAGFEEIIADRVWFVRVRSRGEAIRSYRLTYEDESTSGGVTRLAMVERIGRGGSVYPIVHRFGYSRSLGGVCGTGRCDRPFLVDMGTLPGAAGIATGDATLVDINGDSLPDLVDSSRTGPHRFYINVLEGAGRARFDAESSDSATTERSGFELSQPYVQILDVNGDGFADLVNARTRQVRCNHASGDWQMGGCGALSEVGFTLEDDGVPGDGDSDPVRTRFMDLNGDRRIDILRTNSATEVEAWLNTGGGFMPFDVEPLGRVFDGDRLQLADMNGDGLLDPVVIEGGVVRYRLNYGWGRWGEWITAQGPIIGSDSEMNDTEVQDLNGDGLDDLIIVQGTTVRYSINRNGGRFDPFVSITGRDVEGGLPVRDTTTTVLFADMNGSGSRDAVWVMADGRVAFLELFPVRPNLMSRLENGIGMVHEITYGTSVAHQASSDEPWQYTLPYPMNLVDRTDTWVTLTGGDDGAGLHEVVEMSYRDGYYDGVEKVFRGFARVEQRLLADMSRDSQEPALTVQEFDIGASDAYRAGLMLRNAVFSGDEERPLSEVRHVYADCTVAGLPTTGLRFPVRHVCEREQTSIRQEGVAATDWATVRTETQYDGYGQVVRTDNLGVVHMGPPETSRACGPCDRPEGTFGAACDAECVGDEMSEVRELIEPGSATGGRWILGRPHTVRRFAQAGGPATEEQTYYDGPDFVGLARGQLRNGLPTRVRALVREGEYVDTSRNAYDQHGNVIGTLDPLGAPDDFTGHRRAYTMDASGLRVVRVEIFLSTPEGEPYRLRQELAYEPAFDKVIESTAWMVEGAGASSARNSTYYAYDEFARVVAIAKPGDTLEAPTMEVSWELGDPASRIVVRRRSQPGSAPDIETVQCADGRGRVFQERTRVTDGEWAVNGFIELNRRGAEVRIYQPYTESTGACAFQPPTGVPYGTVQYDGAQREILRTVPDQTLYGSASTARTVYEPLATLRYDENDTDPESPHADTPDVTRIDGMDRPVARERILRTERGLEPMVTHLFYDAAGSLGGYVDPLGNLKRQEIDLLGRVVRIDDPNAGVTSFEHDAAGNVTARTDARGVTSRTEYDGANRPVVRFDAADPAATRITYRYDIAGACDRSACTNTAGQLVETAYPLAPGIAERLGGTAMGYDRMGYDARSRPVYQSRQLGNLRLETRQRIDGADRPVESTFPDGQRLVRRFDGASRLVRIDGLIEHVQYDARGLRARVIRADGSEDLMEHDALMRLARLRTVTGDGSTIQDYRYRRDRVGQILEIGDEARVPAGFARADARYTYDALYRLVGATLEPERQYAETVTWRYDAIDNALSAISDRGGQSAAHVGQYEYERSGVTRRAGSLETAHDAAGFLRQRGAVDLEWDFLGRLTRASRRGLDRGIFVYGSDQSRVAKLEEGSLTIYVGPDFEIRDGVSRVYARIERDRVARVQSTALAVAIYGDANGSGTVDAGDAWLTPSGGREGVLIASARRLLHEEAPEPTHLFYDHLGSLTGASRAGEVTGVRRYYPRGEIRAETGFIDERGFTGQERDASTGLIAFEWRYLDPALGRWISPDPAFERFEQADSVAEGTARYAYVGGNPVAFVDPTGLDRLEAAAKFIGRVAPYVAQIAASNFGKAVASGDTTGAWTYGVIGSTATALDLAAKTYLGYKQGHGVSALQDATVEWIIAGAVALGFDGVGFAVNHNSAEAIASASVNGGITAFGVFGRWATQKSPECCGHRTVGESITPSAMESGSNPTNNRGTQSTLTSSQGRSQLTSSNDSITISIED